MSDFKSGNGARMIKWPEYLLPQKFPIQNSRILWRVGSSFVVPTIAVLSKIWLTCLNHVNVINSSIFHETLKQHHLKDDRSLITISNHTSCLDDPLIWGALLPMKWNLRCSYHRWTAAADDVCFTKSYHSLFFFLGKTFPLVRGGGIYQPSMDFALELLNERQFLHIFPEGKIVLNDGDENQETLSLLIDKSFAEQSLTNKTNQKQAYQFKWGLARLVLDLLKTKPDECINILPFYHVGMNDVLPTVKPYIPKINQKVTIYVRDDGPIEMNSSFLSKIFQEYRPNNKFISLEEKRIVIMKYLENEMNAIKLKAIHAHQQHI